MLTIHKREQRRPASASVCRCGAAVGVTALARALNDEAPPVRVQALSALRRLQCVQAIPALAELLVRDPEVTVRRAAAAALGTFREQSAMSCPQAALADSELFRTSASDPGAPAPGRGTSVMPPLNYDFLRA
jgi:HEAT repeat protein